MVTKNQYKDFIRLRYVAPKGYKWKIWPFLFFKILGFAIHEQLPRYIPKKHALKNFPKIQPAALLKKRPCQRCFPVNLAKCLRT